MDLAFSGAQAYVAATGADALFRLTTSGAAIGSVGSGVNDFIDLRASGGPPTLPVGLAMASSYAVAFVAEDGVRRVSAVSLPGQVSIATMASSAPAAFRSATARLR